MKLDKFIPIARKISVKSDARQLHVSLIILRNKVICAGWNSLRTHPFAYYSKYKYSYIHSELSALTKFNHRENNIEKCTMINIRLARANDGLLIAKPCPSCLDLVASFGIKTIFYSVPGGFKKL